MTSATVVCMGEILMEFVAKERNVPLSQVSHFKTAPGGAPFNVAVALQKLGVPSAFVGCVGTDAFGEKLHDALVEHGVDTSNLARAHTERTRLIFTAVHDDGHKDVLFYRDADSCLKYNPINAPCFHYGSISLISDHDNKCQRQAMQAAHQQQDCMVTYDPNYRPTLWKNKEMAHSTMFEALQYANMVKISIEEFAIVTGTQDLQQGIRAVLDQGVELLIVSKGSDGAMATNGDFVVESPAISPGKIVDTTGAGDAMMAAMIARLLPDFQRLGSLKRVQESTVQNALDFANVVAGLTCTKVGAIPALPTQAEVDGFLHAESTTLSPETLAKMLDHTLLKPYCVDPFDLEKLCKEAKEYGFATVAVNPSQVETCCRLLKGSSVGVVAAVGFPLGQTTTAVKAFETRNAIECGATEIDVVLNVRALQAGQYDFVRDELQSVLDVCREYPEVICKVILETCYLSKEEKIKACEICRNVRVDFVKTSTGFGTGGATVDDIKLMRNVVGEKVGVKASGGIRDLATAQAMVSAGANRIGTSSGVAIIDELIKQQNKDDK